jgi:serine/threonine protein kinase
MQPCLRQVSALQGATGSAAHPRFAPGETLFGRYRVVRLLGRGGMGEVYQALDLATRRTVAAKVARSRFSPGARGENRFARELALCRSVRHPSLCRAFGLLAGDPRASSETGISLQLLPGESLAVRLGGAIRITEARRWVTQLAAGLAALHGAGVVHLDVKPANVMLVPDGGSGRAVLVDFGAARAVSGEDGRAVDAGSPGYLAPELSAGAPVSPLADVYALGRLMLSFRPSQRWSSAPARHWELVAASALSAEPRGRPESAAALVDLLARSTGSS